MEKTDFAAAAGRLGAVPICLTVATAMELRVGPGQAGPGWAGSEIAILHDHEGGFPVTQNLGFKFQKA